MSVSLLLSLQKFSIHDGPGIRTVVFFKGCPLRCSWCHNPESQQFDAELMFDAERCTSCGRCVDVCPSRATVRLPGGGVITDRSLCQACGECTDLCLSCVREIAGTFFSPADILREIGKDFIFYEQSGGGVTFSGGEALCHTDALESLAAQCHRQGLHVTIDTCGHVPQDAFRRLLPHTDLFLYDLKHMDPDRHLLYTGQDNRLILSNLRFLSDAGATIWLRVPLIAGVNDDDENLSALREFVQPLRISQVQLLPYHHIGSSKLARLGRAASDDPFAAPVPDRLEAIRSAFEEAGFSTRIGG